MTAEVCPEFVSISDQQSELAHNFLEYVEGLGMSGEVVVGGVRFEKDGANFYRFFFPNRPRFSMFVLPFSHPADDEEERLRIIDAANKANERVRGAKIGFADEVLIVSLELLFAAEVELCLHLEQILECLWAGHIAFASELVRCADKELS